MNEQNQQDPLVNLMLKVSQINLILTALDELPRRVSDPIFQEIQKQAISQLQQPAGDNSEPS